MNQDLLQRNQLKGMDQQINQRETEDTLKMFSENAAKEIQREREYKQKFEKFNQKEAAHRDNYKSSVYQSDQQRQLDKMNWINRNANEHQMWLSEKDKMEKQMRNQAINSTNELIKA